MNMLDLAMKWAVTNHTGQTDKAGVPYISHICAVVAGVEGEHEKVAAALHDIAEDTGVTIENIANAFGETIAGAVDALTKREGESHADYMQRILDNDIAIRVKLADMTHNSDIRRLVAVTEKDRRRQAKYIQSISELRSALQLRVMSEMPRNTPRQNRLIVALDTPDVQRADRIIESLGADVSFYKIGYQLMPVGGLDLAQRLSASGKKVFLDFKFHDIGATVERGVASVAKLGGDILTVHAEPDVLKGAVAGRGDDKRLKIFAVTVLTSLSQESLAAAGLKMSLEDLVLKRAEMAAKAGADGVIASAKEAAAIRARFGAALKIATPGVRPAGADANDQARVVTPADAIRAGADYLVIGRPIVAAPSPSTVVRAIASEIAGAA